jgi:hypothetical protein
VHAWNPVTRVCRWAIEFETDDGVVHTAFEYVWRVWTPCEITRALEAAGFAEVQHLYARCDGDNTPEATVCASVVGSVEVDNDNGDCDHPDTRKACTAVGTGWAGADAAGRLEMFAWSVRVGDGEPVECEVCAVQAGGRVVLSPCDPTAEVEIEVDASEHTRFRVGVEVRIGQVDTTNITGVSSFGALPAMHLVWRGLLSLDLDVGEPYEPDREINGGGCAAWAGSVSCVDGMCSGGSAGSGGCGGGGGADGGAGAGECGGAGGGGGGNLCALKKTAVVSDVCVAVTADVVEKALAQALGDSGNDLDNLPDWYSYVLAVRMPDTSSTSTQ